MRSHREKRTDQGARQTQRQKHLGVKKSSLQKCCKGVRLQKDRPRASLPLLYHWCVSAAMRRWLGRWAGPRRYGPLAMQRSEKREVRKKLKAQAYCSDYLGFKRQRSKPKRDCTGLVCLESPEIQQSHQGILSLSPSPPLTPPFLGWLPSLIDSFRVLPSGNSSIMINR